MLPPPTRISVDRASRPQRKVRDVTAGAGRVDRGEYLVFPAQAVVDPAAVQVAVVVEAVPAVAGVAVSKGLEGLEAPRPSATPFSFRSISKTFSTR